MESHALQELKVVSETVVSTVMFGHEFRAELDSDGARPICIRTEVRGSVGPPFDLEVLN